MVESPDKEYQKLQSRLKEAEEALAKSESLYKAWIDFAPDPFYMLDALGRYTYGNKKAAEISGYAIEELIGKEVLSIVPGSEYLKLAGMIKDIIVNRKVGQAETFILKKDGTLVPIESRIAPFFHQGKFGGFMGISQDISERKRAGEKLRISEEKYRGLFNNSPEAITLVDGKGFVIEANKRIFDITGYNPQEIIGIHVSKLPFISEETRVGMSKNFARRSAGEDIPPYETAFTTKKDEKRVGLLYATTLYDEKKQFVVEIVAVIDITDRKRAEEEIKKSQDFFKGVTENSSDVIIIVDRKATVKYVSPHPERFLGYKLEEIIGRKAFDFIKPADIPRAIADFAKAILTKGNVVPDSFRMRHKDGSERIFEGYGRNLFDDPAVEGFVMNVHDITDRKQAEGKLRESEEEYRLIFEIAQDAIFTLDPKGNFISGNKKAEEISGYGREELIGKPFMQIIQAKDIPRLLNALKDTLTKGSFNFEVEIVRKDGALVPIEIMGSALKKEGKIVGVHGIARDISERKKTEDELKRRAEELGKMNKFMVGRETAMIELKKEIDRLLAELGRPEKYRNE